MSKLQDLQNQLDESIAEESEAYALFKIKKREYDEQSEKWLDACHKREALAKELDLEKCREEARQQAIQDILAQQSSFIPTSGLTEHVAI